MVTKMAKVNPYSCEVFYYSLRLVALKNTIWNRSDELKEAFFKGTKIC